jgi:hypothetical protein
MTCGGSHLGFPIGIKNRGPSNDHSIKAKLYMNVHWMVLYKLYVFCSDMKFKMATTAELSLTLDPMGKMFQNASSLKPLGQLKPNCPGMIIGRSSTKFMFFMPIGNPRWWFQLAQWFRRRNLKCEKFTDDGRQVMAIVHMDLVDE